MILISKRGFTIIGLLVTMAVSIIALGGIYEVFVFSHRSYLNQESITEMQQNARSAIEFMTRELRNAVVIDPVATDANSVTFYTDTNYSMPSRFIVGVSTGGNVNNTLNDSSQFWSTNAYQGKSVAISKGKGAHQVRNISSNTQNQLTLSSDWDALGIPDQSSVYHLDVKFKKFSRGSDGILRYSKGGSINQPLVNNISNLRFNYDQDSGDKKLYISLTARSPRVDPGLNNQYHYYRVESMVSLLNLE